MQPVADQATNQNFQEISKRFPISARDLGATAPTETSLPTTGLFPGRQIVYKAAVAIYWLLVYTGEETYPWAKIGGPPLGAEVATNQGTKSATFTNLTTVGPSLTLPLKGDYDIEIGALANSGASGTNAAQMSYALGGTAATEADAVETDFSPFTEIGRKKRKTGLNAGIEVVAKYRSTGGVSEAKFANRRLFLDPIRVG